MRFDRPWDRCLLVEIAQHCGISCMQRVPVGDVIAHNGTRPLCDVAADTGNLPVLAYLRSIGASGWSERTCSSAAFGGHLEVLQWLKANGCPRDSRVFRYAGLEGHMHVLEWAFANGCPRNAEVRSFAACEAGNLRVVQWAHANGFEMDYTTCANAAREGNMDILQWARANGCPWNVNICADAAEGGQLGVLQWLRANGCPWDYRTCWHAANWSIGYPTVGAQQRMPLGRRGVGPRCRALRSADATVVACKRLSMG
jgi:hypothetical protein